MPPTVPALIDALLHGEGPTRRRALAKAITLVESTRDDHRAQADALLDAVMPHTGHALRLGISGVPGVGKSTFIEALGMFLLARGYRVAVLAVDPSSSLSGGSILGDKTRMERLSMDERAYIRPSPSAGTLGGVAEKTREALLLCEAAGHDVVIVETVGVGQSETAVAAMTDGFVLLQLPNAGDDLQALKKGVMEIADLVVINKADLDPVAATRARAQVTGALRLVGGVHAHGHAPGHAHAGDSAPAAASAPWSPRVMQLSALTGSGLDEFWTLVTAFRVHQQASGDLAARRHRQDQAWMWERIGSGLQQRFRQHAAVRDALAATTAAVREGRLAPSRAARGLLALMDGGVGSGLGPDPASTARSGLRPDPTPNALDHLNLRAPAALLRQLRDFYVDVVGLRDGPRPAFNSAGYWLYAGDAAVLHLSTQRDGEPPRGPVDAAAPGTYDHMAFRAPDRDAAAARLVARGVPFREARDERARQHQFFFSDPAGNGVELNFPYQE